MDDAKRSEAPGGSWQAIGREWLDTLVVAISVAMCFRAYFYEPFNIPTGSMRPTLYGNYTEAEQPGSDGFFDLPVLSFFKFALTGETYKEFRAPWSGTVRVASRGDGCYDLVVANALHHPETNLKGVKALGRWLMGLVAENEYENHIGVAKIPTDAMDFRAADGARVNKGDLLWCGRVKKGDFIFVNRWLWNFRKPARGDVMIFSTTGIAGLQQGTHYIKRLTATPGDTLEIKDAAVYIDGERQPSLKPETGAAGEASPRYDAGPMTGPVTLGADEYFACGDNSYPAQMSFDSRYWGTVPGTKLRGVAACVFWPIVNPRIGRIK